MIEKTIFIVKPIYVNVNDGSKIDISKLKFDKKKMNKKKRSSDCVVDGHEEEKKAIDGNSRKSITQLSSGFNNDMVAA